ncbi:RNA polymerase III RPC4-domain-containing protein [Dipodascopsis uninucleata]
MPPKQRSTASDISQSMTSKMPESRLDSLSSSRRSGSSQPSQRSVSASPAVMSGLKFKPKLVARRTKEERDAEAPAIKVEEQPRSVSIKPTRGTPSGRGRGRGRGRSEPVAAMAAGPFSNPQFGDLRRGRAQAIERQLPSENSNNPFANGNIKFETQQKTRGATLDGRYPDPDELSEDDGIEGINMDKIDISKISSIEGEDARYFPVRDETFRVSEPENVLSDESITEAEKKEGENILPSIEAEDIERKLFFFQFAPILPDFKSTEAVIKKEISKVKKEDAIIAQGSESSVIDVDIKPELIPSSSKDGLVGRLLVHKSGKLSVTWGDIDMEVYKGANTDFLQDVVVIDKNERQATLIGHVQQKIVVTPNIDSLFVSDSEDQ